MALRHTAGATTRQGTHMANMNNGSNGSNGNGSNKTAFGAQVAHDGPVGGFLRTLPTTNPAYNGSAQVWQYERAHTRDGHGSCTYSMVGTKGRCWMSNDAMLANDTAWPATLVVVPGATAVPDGETGAVLAYKGSTPNGDRHRYAAPGMVGYAQVAATWFGDVPPATLAVLGVAFADAATTAARRAATARRATSAVVATANMAHAALTGAPVATPQGEAATAAVLADGMLAQVATDKGKGKGKGKGKAHTEAVS